VLSTDTGKVMAGLQASTAVGVSNVQTLPFITLLLVEQVMMGGGITMVTIAVQTPTVPPEQSMMNQVPVATSVQPSKLVFALNSTVGFGQHGGVPTIG
jgi:hypothetical protein